MGGSDRFADYNAICLHRLSMMKEVNTKPAHQFEYYDFRTTLTEFTQCFFLTIPSSFE